MTAQHRTVGSLCDTAPVPQDRLTSCAICGVSVTPDGESVGLTTPKCRDGRRHQPAPVPQDTNRLSEEERWALEEAREPECEMWVNGLTEVYDPAPDSDDPDREQRIDISVPALAALVAEREVEAVLADRAAERECGRAEVEQALAEVYGFCQTRAIGAHASGSSMAEREWLDVLHLLDRARAYRGGDDRG